MGKLAARNQHAAFAGQADHANVCAGPVNLPLDASAGMGLAQFNYISDVDLFIDFHGMDRYLTCNRECRRLSTRQNPTAQHQHKANEVDQPGNQSTNAGNGR
jgi:hypothetical protein